MAKKGLKELGASNPKLKPTPGTFEWHIKNVEDKFEEDFHVFASKKETWWKDYQKRGWFQTMTGFIIRALSGKAGLVSHNNLMNDPIQGPAFHLLLWSLIQITKELERKGMKSKIVGQIHDSIVAYIHVSEIQEFLTIAQRVMTIDIRKHWDWIIVPMSIEAEVTPEGGTWATKEPWVEKNGIWQPKKKAA